MLSQTVTLSLNLVYHICSLLRKCSLLIVLLPSAWLVPIVCSLLQIQARFLQLML